MVDAVSEILDVPIRHSGAEPDLSEVVAALARRSHARAVAVLLMGDQPRERVLAEYGLTADDRTSLTSALSGMLAWDDAADHWIDESMFGVSVLTVLPGRRDMILVLLDAPGTLESRVLSRVAAERVARSLEVGRLRFSLDRAMAQILETDERLLGRIGLDIHDGPTQHLSVALLELQLLEGEIQDADPSSLPEFLAPALERIYETVGGALAEMRELIGHLRPAQFTDRRLTEILGDAIAGFEARSGIDVNCEMQGEFAVDGVSVTQRIILYRILQEALGNAYRHGKARNAWVTVVEDCEGITLEVTDDGVGFDADSALRPVSGAPIARFGLHGMRDRADVLGGTMAVTSKVGEGSTVRVFLPRWMPGSDGQD